MYLPAVKSKDLKESVAFAKKVEARLIALTLENDERRRALSAEDIKHFRIWPVNFLEELQASQGAMERFEAWPNRWNAWRMILRQQAASRAYVADAVAIRKSYEAVSNYVPGAPLPQSPRYFLDRLDINVVTSNIIVDDLRLIEKNGEHILRVLAERKQCLFRGKCQGVTLRNRLAQVSYHEDSRPLLPEKVLNSSYYNFARPLGLFQAPSRCFISHEDGKETLSPFLLVEERWNNLPTIIRPILANERYYVEIPSTPRTNPPEPFVFKFMRERGLNYFSSGPAGPDKCADLSFYPQLATIYYVAQFLKETSGIFANSNISTPSALAAAKAERDFMASEMPSYADLLNLYQNYLATLEDQETLVSSGIQPERIREVISVIEAQTPFFPELLNLAVFSSLAFLEELNRSTYLANMNYLFTARTHYSLLFLPFSSAFWRLSEKPRYHMPYSAWQKEFDQYVESLRKEQGAPPAIKPETFGFFFKKPRVRTFSDLHAILPAEILIAIEKVTQELDQNLMPKALELIP
jgi:hypothetical protein